MPCSPRTIAQRAFVRCLLSLAAVCDVVINVNRDSSDEELLKAYRRVAVKAHPDKGGNTRKFQEFQAAKQQWDTARKSGAARGRPKVQPGGQLVVSPPSGKSAGKRVRGFAVLLTYFGKWSLALWRSFIVFVQSHLMEWSVLR